MRPVFMLNVANSLLASATYLHWRYFCSFSFSYLSWTSYAKAYDPDNWFTIDEETAEIKLNKQPDRESPFLVNGTYIAKILAMTNGNTTCP